jgi:hypothetical protein
MSRMAPAWLSARSKCARSPGRLKLPRLLGLLGLLGGALFADLAAAAPFGPTGTLGPAGATVRTCDGLANCFVCSTGSCVPSGSWQSLIQTATAGRTVLLRTGNYDPSGTLTVPSGTSAAPILVGSYNGERPVIVGPVRVNGSFVTVEGLKIQTSTDSYALQIERASSTALQNITLKNLEVLGGTGDGIRIRSNVRDTTLLNSIVDGGRNNHAMKILCSSETSANCQFIPENIKVHNNEFHKQFFGTTATEDLIQIEGTGNVEITSNDFSANPGEECVDIKAFGRTGASLTIGSNVIRSDCGGLLIIQQARPGAVVVEGNHLVGGGSLIRHAVAQVSDNWIDGQQLTIAGSVSNVIVGHNTFSNPGNALTFGDSAGRPGFLRVINNIFSRTAFRGTSGSYNATDNLRFQTTGSTLGSCGSCVSGDPLLNGYEIAVGSMAEDAASTAFAVPTDIEGTVRPQGVAADIGAYEIAGGGELPEPPVIDFPEISFNWRTEGATTCTAAGNWDGTRAASGDETLQNPADGEFILECEGPGGSATRSLTITTMSAP